MEILKSYRDDFKKSFQKDGGRSILDLLEDAKLNNEKISDKFYQIAKKKEEISKLEDEKDKDKTEELYSRSSKIILEIGSLKDKKTRGEKRLEKLGKDKKEITIGIRENIEKLGAELQ